MEQPKVATSRLFVTSIIEGKRDEIEEKLEQGYQTLQGLVSGLSSEKETHDALNSAVSRDKAHEESVCLGLLCVILSEPQHAAKSFRDLALVTRDGLSLVLIHLSQLVVEKWLRMTDVARSQLLWLLRELIRTGVAGVDNVCYNLMRHAAGGDLSHRNIALVDYMLDIFIENRVWLEKHPILLSSMVYNYLRLIEDHLAPQFTVLRQKEITFLVSLLRERFADCLVIGRDLIRLLQNIARLPEIELLWRDILNNPKSLCPTFTGVLQLLQSRTSRRFLQGRLTPEMERKVVFLTSHVRFGNHKRYQDWFQKQYLATPESQTLRIDLIRFIVGVIHPTNELLCSDIIPRWAIIGWLLTSCTSQMAAANAKLALFYDWLFFDTDRDNIMNIEPGILVMHHSMRSHPAVTATLLDFLCRIIPEFCPPLSDKVRQGIYTSLRHITEKRVLPSLFPLFDYNRLDKDLRVMVRETFHEFCYPQPSVEGAKIEENTKEDLVNHTEDARVGNHSSMANSHGLDSSDPSFSDEETEALHIRQEDEDDDDIPLEYNNTSCHFFKDHSHIERIKSMIIELYSLRWTLPCYSLPYLVHNHHSSSKAKVKLKGSPLPEDWRGDDEDVTKGLEGPLSDAMDRLHQETDNETKCEAMERLVQLVIQDEEVDSDTLTSVGQCLCRVLRSTWSHRVFPDPVTQESIEDSIGRPLFVLFRNLAELSEDDSRRLPLLTVLSEMYNHHQRIGYLLLYYLQASTNLEEESSKVNSNGKSQVYKELCETQDKELEAGLLADLKLCQEEDVSLLCWLLPAVYTQFPQVAVGNTALLHLVVSTVDARQLQDLVCRVVQGRLVMFRGDSFQAVLSASLTWETFEQFCLWQLVTAHGIPIDYVLPILPRLEYSTHAEALTAILLMLKQERPTAELVKQVLCRDVSPPGDMFVVSALRCWCREHEERLAELVAALLTACYPHSSPNKRKRGKPSGNPAPEKLLAHLDRLRPGCRQLYKMDCMQRALQQAQASCTDAQKSHFSNLFALVELDDPGRGKGRGRKPGKSKPKSYKGVSDTSEESSEEEEVVIKMKQAKKRKKTNPVNSDSD